MITTDFAFHELQKYFLSADELFESKINSTNS